MSARFYNTLSNKVDEFKPLQEGRVGMYTCGPTVYDYAHIGNFRAFVFEDLLRRFLECSGYKVHHVMNLTDVDDKTIAGAQSDKVKLTDYTERYTRAFNDDLRTLNCLLPSSQPKATQKIQIMLDLIQKLMDAGIAYENNGSVYYRVSKFKNYGKLSKKKLEMNITGASERVEADEYESKEAATDFVLWKGVKDGEAEIGAAWASPWGQGRPGWHIECSAMSMEELEEQFDIHAGGEDLIFPHHENEIAQSEGATGKEPFVRYWLHCKFLLVDGEKMSKSKGNFYTLRDLLAKGCDPMAVRFALLSTHYRSAMNFTLDGVKEAGEVIRKLDDCYWQCVSRLLFNLSGEAEDFNPAGLFDKILRPLGDDLNISACFAELLSGITQMNSQMGQMSRKTLENCVFFFEKLDKLLGLEVAAEQYVPADVVTLVHQRSEIRRRIKDENNKTLWPESDKLRDQIQALGWLVKDARPGEPSTLKFKRRKWDV